LPHEMATIASHGPTNRPTSTEPFVRMLDLHNEGNRPFEANTAVTPGIRFPGIS
jgi:hypothetical protein